MLCALLALGLSASGCAIPEMGSYLTTIPKTLQTLDHDVVSASAYSRTGGLAREVVVDVDLNRSTVSTEELRTFLETIVPLVDQPGASRIEVNFNDFSSTATDTLMGDPIDISDSRADLFRRWDLVDHSGQYDTNSVNEDLSALRDKIKEVKKQR